MISYALLIAVCFLACVLGPTCGIGGGVIIKPAIDALGLMGVNAASFLSGITVLAMAAFTVARRVRANTLQVDMHTMLPICLGSACGGALGKALFTAVSHQLDNPALVGGAQAGLLLALTALSIFFTLEKDRLPHPRLGGMPARAALGVLSGAVWSFLGIGGGPFNLVLLVFFLDMDTLAASQASLLIIAFSQTAGLASMLAAGTIPGFSPADLAGMIAAAIAGSLGGMALSGVIEDAARNRLYLFALALIALICAHNLVSFLG